MKYHYDLSVIVPGIRNENWTTLVEHMKTACKRYSYELIFSGPYPLPESLQAETNIKYIKNFGSPTKALHLGTLISEGRFFTWLADDAHLYNDSIDKSLDLLLANNPQKDFIGMRYTEGPAHSGAEFSPSYWVTGTHPDLCAPGVNRDYKVCGVLLCSLERYRELGGLDHDYLHINMNVHDLAIRAQNDGSNLFLSPTQIQNCDFEVDRTCENSPVIAAFWNNDRQLFLNHYKDGSRPIKIDPENWREAAPVWNLRFK